MAGRKARALNLRDIGALYTRMENVHLGLCYYCSEPRQSLDHVPPLALARNLDLAQFRERGGVLLLVPCCHQCNNLLGARHLATVDERAVFLWSAYAQLIDKTYKGWTEDELAELGPNMHSVVLAGMRRVKRYIVHLRGLEQRLLSLDVKEPDDE